MKKRGEVKLFNFSFVDILATTIGVLLFIMIMAVLNMSGMVARADAVKTKHETKNKKVELEKQIADLLKKFKDLEKKKARLSSVKATKNVTGRELQAQILREANIRIKGEIAQLKDKIDELNLSIKDQDRKITDKADQIRRYKTFSHRMFPQSVGGSSATPVHVECRKDGVVILGTNTEQLGNRTLCRVGKLSSASSEYGKLIREVASKRNYKGVQKKVIVLWVRPDAFVTSRKAIAAAKKVKAPIGWEPAAADWKF